MKNFKCQNSNCKVSFKAESLGPCPICGSEITKPDKSNILPIILSLAIIISAIGVGFVLLSPSNSVDEKLETADEVSTIDQVVSVSEKCYLDVRLTKPKVNKSNKEVEVLFASNSDSCSFLFKINKLKKQTSNKFTITKNLEKLKNFEISVFTENDSLLANQIFSNPYYVKPTKSKDFEKYINDFENTLDLHLKDLKENQESDYDSKLRSIFVKNLGLDADKTKINVKIKSINSNVSLNGLMTDLENDAYSDIFYTFKMNVEKETKEGISKVKKINITLSQTN